MRCPTGMTAHARYGTWLLVDDERDRVASDEGSVALAPPVRPHIVHLNGRSFLPPEIKLKVEARFREQQQQQQQQSDGEAQQHDETDGTDPMATVPGRRRQHPGRHDERERLRETLRTELGL